MPKTLSKQLHKLGGQWLALAEKVEHYGRADELHDLRVLTRRLRALVWVARHSETFVQLKKMRRLLKELCRVFGERRAMDVLKRDALKYGLGSRTGDRRKRRATSQVRYLLRPRQRNEMACQFKKAEEKLGSVSEGNRQRGLRELVFRLGRLSQFRPDCPEDWHRFRIRIKKIRYALEIYGVDVPGLKVLQDILGRAHDLHVLSEAFPLRTQVQLDRDEQWELAAKIRTQGLAQAKKRAEEFLDVRRA